MADARCCFAPRLISHSRTARGRSGQRPSARSVVRKPGIGQQQRQRCQRHARRARQRQQRRAENVMRPRPPMRCVQRVKQSEQLIGRQLRGATTQRQRIQSRPAARCRSGQAAQRRRPDQAGSAPGTSAMRSPFGSMTTTARPAAMSCVMRFSSSVDLPVPVGPSRCKCRSESVAESASGRSRPGKLASPMTCPLRGIAVDGATKRLPS